MKSIKNLTMEQLIEKVNKYSRVLDRLEAIHLSTISTMGLEVKLIAAMERVWKMEFKCDQQLTNLISSNLKKDKWTPDESILAFFKESEKVEKVIVKLLTGLRDKYSTVEGK